MIDPAHARRCVPAPCAAQSRHEPVCDALIEADLEMQFLS